MPVRHINPKAPEESGIFVSGDAAKKVFSIFSKPKSNEDIKKSSDRIKKLIASVSKRSKE